MRKITFATREINKLLDETLMDKHHFASETLMELAGLAAAQVAHKILRAQRDIKHTTMQEQSISVLVGPGNNGGDGLVAARHLKMMKYSVDLITFKTLEGKNGNYLKLCQLNDILWYTPEHFKGQNGDISQKFVKHLQGKTLIIDAIFGFPFTGEIRQPYRDFIYALKPFQDKIFSVDIPSGWDANEGNIHQLFTPAYLISLGVPKKCSENYKGEHYFGGRFVPQAICRQLDLSLPQFEQQKIYCKL